MSRALLTGFAHNPTGDTGGAKHLRLGREFRLHDVESPSKERMAEIAGWVRGFGLEVHVNG